METGVYLAIKVGMMYEWTAKKGNASILTNIIVFSLCMDKTTRGVPVRKWWWGWEKSVR